MLQRTQTFFIRFAVILALGLGFVQFSQAPANAASYYDIYCPSVTASNGYYNCDNDRRVIAPGEFVRITLTSTTTGGRTVKFRVYNANGHHLLGETTSASEGQKVFAWRNDTSNYIEIDWMANVSGVTGSPNVNARVHISTF